MRSHLLEGTVAHRRSRPVEYALQHDVVLPGARPRRARRGRPTAAAAQPKPAQPPRVPRRRPLAGPGDRPAGDRARPPPRRGRGPDGLADHAGHERAGLRLRLQPGQLLPVPRRRRRPACRHRRGAQHAPGAPSLHAPPVGRGRPVPRLDGQGVLRLAVHRHGGRLHGPRRRRARPPAHRHQRATGRCAAAGDQPGPAPPPADRPDDRPDAPPPPVR